MCLGYDAISIKLVSTYAVCLVHITQTVDYAMALRATEIDNDKDFSKFSLYVLYSSLPCVFLVSIILTSIMEMYHYVLHYYFTIALA